MLCCLNVGAILQSLGRPSTRLSHMFPKASGSVAMKTSSLVPEFPGSQPNPSTVSPSPSINPSVMDNSYLNHIIQCAELEHDREIADPESAYRRQLPDGHAEMDRMDRFDIPGDPTSQRMAMFANAARPGQRSQQYVAPLVENVYGYFERAIVPLMDEIERSREELTSEQNAIREADKLIADIEDGSV
jgi:hypothetical protein